MIALRRWYFFFLSFVMLPLIPELPGKVLAICFVFASSVFVENYFPAVFERRRYVSSVLVLFGATMVFFDHHTFYGIEPATELLVLISALKLVESDSKRDFIALNFILLLLTLHYLLLSPDLISTIYLFLSIIAAAIGLFVIHTPRGHVRSVFKASTRDVLKDLALSVPLFIIGFLFFPRVSSPWGTPITDEKKSIIGFSNEMNLQNEQVLSQSNEIAFRVERDGENTKAPIAVQNLLGASSNDYWRGAIFENTDGWSWSMRNVLMPVPNQLPQDQSTESYIVTMEPTQNKNMFVLESTTFVDLVSGPKFFRVRKNAGGTFQSELEIYSRIKYRGHLVQKNANVDVQKPDVSARHLVMMAKIPETVSEKFRSAILKAVEKIPEGDAKRLWAIVRYLRNQDFVYSLNPPAANSLDQFVFETKSGLCKHFASSFAIAARVAGFPSRVISGYNGGVYNPFDGQLLVMQNNAHAWVEVFQSGEWKRWDPTRLVKPESSINGQESQMVLLGADSFGSQLSGLLANAAFAAQALNTMYVRLLMDYDTAKQLEMIKLSWLGDFSKTRWKLIFVGIFMMAGCWWILGVILRRQTARDRRVVRYQKFLLSLRKFGINPKPSDPPLVIQTWIDRNAGEHSAAHQSHVRELYGP
jgi:hypothetical protein